jgi:4a-hydroxytetrahydrobiopterin dehydratase
VPNGFFKGGSFQLHEGSRHLDASWTLNPGPSGPRPQQLAPVPNPVPNMDLPLHIQHCAHIPEGTPPLSGDTLAAYQGAVNPRWTVTADARIEAHFTFPDFASALGFVNEVGALADAEDHHPDIFLSWGKVTVRLWTHTVGGVSPNDFILAAKIDTRVPAT